MSVQAEEIKRLIVSRLNYKLSPDQLRDDEPLRGGKLGIDSLDFMDLAVALDETFGVTIADEDIWSIKTIKDVVAYINQRRSVHEGQTAG